MDRPQHHCVCEIADDAGVVLVGSRYIDDFETALFKDGRPVVTGDMPLVAQPDDTLAVVLVKDVCQVVFRKQSVRLQRRRPKDDKVILFSVGGEIVSDLMRQLTFRQSRDDKKRVCHAVHQTRHHNRLP